MSRRRTRDRKVHIRVFAIVLSHCWAWYAQPLLSSARPRRTERDSAGLGAQASLAPREILDRLDDLYRGESSHGRFAMTVKTVHWERALEIEFWDKGKTQSLFRILAPKKEMGSATLRSGNDLWNFLPRVDRVIKLPSSMLSAS